MIPNSIRNRWTMLRAVAAAVSVMASPLAANAAPQPAISVFEERPTEAEIAASPAAQRLLGILAAINSNDPKAMEAFASAYMAPPGEFRSNAELAPVSALRHAYRASRGYTIEEIIMARPASAAAYVINNATGLSEQFAVQVRPQAPHRIWHMLQMPALPHRVQRAVAPMAAADDQTKVRDLDKLVQGLADADRFAGTVLIAKDGKPVFSKAYGLANREKRIPNTMDTPFLLASMNKMMTALAIGQLAEQGKLSYEDPLSKFVPGFPNAESARKIKIKHLLSHTSGLGDFRNETYFNAIDRLRDIGAVLAIAPRERIESEPGTKFRYSNLGYLLLGRVIEVASGRDFYSYVQHNIFAPAGMTGSGFPMVGAEYAKVAVPYEVEAKGDTAELAAQWKQVGRGNSAGGGVSTALDLLRFANAIQAGKIVKPSTLELHRTAKRELGAHGYGYGMTTDKDSNRFLYGHGGTAKGTCVDMQIVDTAKSDYTMIVLSNLTSDGCTPVINRALALFGPEAKRGGAPAAEKPGQPPAS